MANLLNNAVAPLNFTCGLIPAAVWTYKIPEAPFPKVVPPPPLLPTRRCVSLCLAVSLCRCVSLCTTVHHCAHR